MLNAAPIEAGIEWNVLREGTTAAVRALQLTLDDEDPHSGGAGLRSAAFPVRVDVEGRGEERVCGNLADERPADGHVHLERVVLREHRFVTEDVFLGLPFHLASARQAALSCPVAVSTLTIFASLRGREIAPQDLPGGHPTARALQSTLRAGAGG